MSTYNLLLRYFFIRVFHWNRGWCRGEIYRGKRHNGELCRIPTPRVDILDSTLKKKHRKKRHIIIGNLLVRCFQDLGNFNQIRSPSIHPDIRTLLRATTGLHPFRNRNLFGISPSQISLTRTIYIWIRALDCRRKGEVTLRGVYELKINGNFSTCLPGIEDTCGGCWEFCNLF